MVRAKFKLISESRDCYSAENRSLKFMPVCDDGTPENQAFYKYTPCGTLELTCNNPQALAQFELGKSYYLDFTPAE